MRGHGFGLQSNYIIMLSRSQLKEIEFVATPEASPADFVATQVVQIVTGLLSSPPGLSEVKTLMETALLCHDSGLTFVPHSKSNFYFLIGESFKERKRPFQKKLAQSQKATVSSGVRQAAKGEVGDGQIDNQVWSLTA